MSDSKKRDGTGWNADVAKAAVFTAGVVANQGVGSYSLPLSFGVEQKPEGASNFKPDAHAAFPEKKGQ